MFKRFMEKIVSEGKTFNNDKVREAADILGSAMKLARAIGVGEVAVYKWIHAKSIPDPINCLKIQKATKGKVKAKDIRPDYEWDMVI